MTTTPPTPQTTPPKPVNIEKTPADSTTAAETKADAATDAPSDPATTREHGGPSGPEPTRYGDWERKGIAVDF